MQCIQVLKEAICHYWEGQQPKLDGKRSIFAGSGVMQMNFDASGCYVNTYTLTKTDFYVLSRAI